MIGAAFAAAAPAVPSWEAGFDNGNNVGGLIQAILSPAGGFGKFLTVVVALFVPSTCAPTIYTFASSFMTIHACFARVPRYVYAVISEATVGDKTVSRNGGPALFCPYLRQYLA